MRIVSFGVVFNGVSYDPATLKTIYSLEMWRIPNKPFQYAVFCLFLTCEDE